MVGRRLIAAGLLALMTGCGTQATLTPLAPASSQAASLQTGSTQTMARIKHLLPDLTVRFLNQKNPKDFQLAPAEAQAFRQLNRDLHRDPALRAQAYTVAEPLVKQFMQKPDKADDLPRISAARLAEMQKILQPGDVIQCGNDSSFIHALLYLGNDVIIHALAQSGNGRGMVGVVRETLSEYFTRVERDQAVILRPTWTAAKLTKAKAYAGAQVGKQYDTLFLTDSDDRFYCTELVAATLTKAGVARIEPQLAKGIWQVVTNDDLRRSPDLKVVYRYNRP